MWTLVTCLHDKLPEVYLGLKKTEEKIHIYQETRNKADEWFQSVHAKALDLKRNGHVYEDSR